MQSGALERKIVVLGGQGVGKTSLIVRYVQDQFTSANASTIGASFFTHKMTLDNCRVKLQIWDTAGQERFRSMAPMYYRGAKAAMLVYDITNPASFESIDSWVKELRENAEVEVMCLLGNKTDLREGAANDTVSAQQGRDYAERVGALFFETSAKDSTGVSASFLHVAKTLLQHQRGGGAGKKPTAAAAGGKVTLGEGEAKSPCFLRCG